MDWAGEKHYIRCIHEDILGSRYYYTNPENGYVTNQHEYTTWGNNTKSPAYNYDPETGSFLSSDPAKSGLNWHQYCNSNPVTYVDPLGLFPTTIQEDDPFFLKKMQDSGGQMSALLNEIDSIALDEFISINMGSKEAWREQQLLTAKYLTFFMLMDPFFTEREYGREMMYAIVGNMFCEAFPGKTEQYNEVGNKKYMEATLRYRTGEDSYYNITQQCRGWANNINIIDKLYEFPNIYADTIGFGFGMLQFTYERYIQRYLWRLHRRPYNGTRICSRISAFKVGFGWKIKIQF